MSAPLAGGVCQLSRTCLRLALLAQRLQSLEANALVVQKAGRLSALGSLLLRQDAIWVYFVYELVQQRQPRGAGVYLALGSNCVPTHTSPSFAFCLRESQRTFTSNWGCEVRFSLLGAAPRQLYYLRGSEAHQCCISHSRKAQQRLQAQR